MGGVGTDKGAISLGCGGPIPDTYEGAVLGKGGIAYNCSNT